MASRRLCGRASIRFPVIKEAGRTQDGHAGMPMPGVSDRRMDQRKTITEMLPPSPCGMRFPHPPPVRIHSLD